MENLFHDCSVDAIYDLKGSERDRYVPSDGAKGAVEPKVLLDENLRELNQASPTLISPLAFGRLQKSLYEDTSTFAMIAGRIFIFSTIAHLFVRTQYDCRFPGVFRGDGL